MKYVKLSLIIHSMTGDSFFMLREFALMILAHMEPSAVNWERLSANEMSAVRG